MKKFLLVSLLLLSVSLYAQTTIDFETVGNNWGWTLFSAGPGGSFDVVANPSIGGLNTSDSCAMLVVGATGSDAWAGTFSTDFPDLTLDSSNCIVKVLAYKDVVSNFDLKLEPPNVDHNVPNTLVNQWEELTFDYTSDIGKTAATLTIIPDFSPIPRTYGSTNYFDYIRFTPITPVPVELTSFTAAIVGNAVQLNWKTATETNNSGFEILKSVNGTQFSRIGFVEGNGTTTESKSYSFVDRSVKAGENYGYRLKQIDLDGTFEYSKVVNVSGITPSEFSLDQNYPNPFNPSTNVSFSVPVKSNVIIEVFNLIGQKVMTLAQGEFEAGKHSVQLNGSSMSSGIYLFKLTAVGENGSQFTSSKKMTLLK